MEINCNEIEKNCTFWFEIDLISDPNRVYAHFKNLTQIRLWVPAESTPPYRPDKTAMVLTISFGYFEEIDGAYRSHYMLPKMDLVQPGRESKIEITWTPLVQLILEQQYLINARIRLATKELEMSLVQEEQPIDDYIINSCVIQSSRVSVTE